MNCSKSRALVLRLVEKGVDVARAKASDRVLFVRRLKCAPMIATKSLAHARDAARWGWRLEPTRLGDGFAAKPIPVVAGPN